MYEKYFSLRRRPFRSTPDSDCYYPATTHELALERLLLGCAQDESPLLLVGEPGTGKTLLCHRLLERLGSEVASAFLTNGHIAGRTGFLQMIHYELALPYAGRGEQELRLALTDFLLQNFKAGRRSLLLMDEAHLLSPDLLEELRLLGNLEARTGRALEIILVAQPALLETLAQPELASLRQRLAVHAVLQPLAADEAADYLLHQLRMAGGRADLISSEALEVLARGTRGVPRLLNQAAHQAFLLAFQAETMPVDAEAAVEALSALRLPFDSEASESTATKRARDDPDRDADSDVEEGAADNVSVHPLAAPETSRHLFVPPRRPAG